MILDEEAEKEDVKDAEALIIAVDIVRRRSAIRLTALSAALFQLLNSA